MPEFPLGFVGAMMLTTAVSVVAIWLVRSVAMEPLRLWWSARHWTRTTCRLARLETDVGPLWYSYRFAGAEYESKRFSTEVTGTEEYLPAQVDELMKVHGLGGDVDGWVNPANPREALLDRSLEAAELLLFAPAVLAVVMFLCALPMAPKFWLWLTYRPDPPLDVYDGRSPVHDTRAAVAEAVDDQSVAELVALPALGGDDVRDDEELVAGGQHGIGVTGQLDDRNRDRV
jgi:hypothetical protein